MFFNEMFLFQLSLSALLCDGGKFWHISDLHLDYEYEAGGDITAFCHHTNNSYDQSVGPAGNYSCDSPLLLVESALQAMARHEDSPDFIVWTGDSAPHWREPQPPGEKYITNVTKFVFSKLDQMFPGVPVVPALGNHDMSPPDQFPISVLNDSHPQYYQTLWSDGAFGEHINTSQSEETFLKCGYYSKTILLSGLKMTFLVLNTNIYYSDFMNDADDEDPCGQLSWLERSLKEADNDTEKVFIVAHVPPGSFERSPGKLNFNTPNNTFEEINKKYMEIVTRPGLSRKISAHLYGHLHTDTFRIFLDGATRSQPVGVAFMAGSVTPVLWVKKIVGVNPTIRLMEYNDDNGILLDYSTYFLDLKSQIVQEKSNDTDETGSGRTNAKFLNSSISKRSDGEKDINGNESVYDLHWEQLYSARQTYQLQDISAESMFEAYKKMVHQEGDIFSQYYKFNTGNNVIGNCDKSCRKNQLCAISNLVLKDLSKCLSNEDGENNDYFYYHGSEQNKTMTTEKINETDPKTTSPQGATDPPVTPSSIVPTGHNENDHSQDSLDDHVEETQTTTEQLDTDADLSVTKEKIEVNQFRFFSSLNLMYIILDKQ